MLHSLKGGAAGNDGSKQMQPQSRGSGAVIAQLSPVVSIQFLQLHIDANSLSMVRLSSLASTLLSHNIVALANYFNSCRNTAYYHIQH